MTAAATLSPCLKVRYPPYPPYPLAAHGTGQRRYVLLPPEECGKLYLYPRDHPEGRHSKVDWSQPAWADIPLMENAL
jgi:hypothetical protein